MTEDNEIPEEMKKQMYEESEENNDEVGNTTHELDSEDLELLDPKLVEKIQEYGHEDMLVEFDGSKRNGSDDDRLAIVREFLSNEDDFRAKTNLTPQQVYALTTLSNLNNMYPNLALEGTQSWLDEFIDDFERYVLSVDGFARHQETNVLRAMFGDTSELDASEKDNMLMSMLSNPPRDNEK